MNKKRILLITTGGTIASKDNGLGLTPQINSKEILSYLDDILDVCDIDTYELFNLDSTNINYYHWLKMVELIEQKYDEYDGFVMTHGTDTMAYTSAALSYLIQNSRKPIVLTGSQKSIYMRDSDARCNLKNEIVFASDDRATGVSVVFDNKAILGTRAKKVRTKSYNAFNSVNYPEIARIRDKKVNFYIPDVIEGKPVFYKNINPSVFVLRLIPGMSLKIFDFILKNYDAIVVESFGVGGIPMYDEKEFSDAIEKLILANKTVVITTQVQYEGSDLSLYQVGKKIKEKYELLEAYDMTIEALVCKLMWIRSQTTNQSKIKEMLYTPINHDISI